MYCSKCGNNLERKDSFCTNCGKKVFDELKRELTVISLGNFLNTTQGLLDLVLEGEFEKISPELEKIIKRARKTNENALRIKESYFNNKIIKEEDSKKSEGQEENKSKKNGCRVMLFEDDPFIGELYENKFLINGFDFKRLLFPSKNFMKEIEDFKPDMILTNITMPEMNGYVLIHKIRQRKKFNSILIVVFTNMDFEENIARALEVGANDYWVCSLYTPDEIVEKTKKLLAVE